MFNLRVAHLFQELHSDTDEGQAKVMSTCQLGERVIQSTAPPGRDNIKQNLAALEQDWMEVVASIGSTETHLEECLVQWVSYEEEHSKLADWLITCEENLKAKSEPVATIEGKEVQLQSVQVNVRLYT